MSADGTAGWVGCAANGIAGGVTVKTGPADDAAAAAVEVEAAGTAASCCCCSCCAMGSTSSPMTSSLIELSAIFVVGIL